MAVFLIILFGLLIGAATIFIITAAMEFLDEDVIGGAFALIVGLVMCFLAAIVFKGIRNNKPDWHEIEAKQIQIDTTYTTTKNKVDTTYVVRYIK